jgi:hypothetical protein
MKRTTQLRLGRRRGRRRHAPEVTAAEVAVGFQLSESRALEMTIEALAPKGPRPSARRYASLGLVRAVHWWHVAAFNRPLSHVIPLGRAGTLR